MTGGAEGEALPLLDFTPHADAPSSTSFTTDAITTDLARLADQQQHHGGWTVDYTMYSPAAVDEWRAYATIQAIAIL